MNPKNDNLKKSAQSKKRRITLFDKQRQGESWWLGKMVRPLFSTGPFFKCTKVEAHGPPSGWAAFWILTLDDPTFHYSKGTFQGVDSSSINAFSKNKIEVQELNH